MSDPEQSPRLARRALLAGALGAGAAALAGCGSPSSPEPVPGAATAAAPSGSGASTSAVPGPGIATPSTGPSPSAPATTKPRAKPATPAQIAARATVPVLCWHQLRDWNSADGEYARTLLICPPKKFRAQLDAVADDGWNTIGPDQYLDHLTTGAALPSKPIMLSFDDSQGSQITEGLPQLRARKMTATFFAMTVVLGNQGWFTRRDLKRLDDAGMTVAAHTWDHHRADEYSGQDWSLQLQKPRELLEKIIGHPVRHFAYPYGAWDRAALPHVAAAGYRTAFQLADRKPDPKHPLLTLRRDLVSSTWTGKQLLTHLRGLVD